MEQTFSSGNPNRSSVRTSSGGLASRHWSGLVLSVILVAGFCAKAPASEKGEETVSVPSEQPSAETASTKCALNQRSIQQAVRAYQNMRRLKAGDPIDWRNIIGKGGFVEAKPICPDGGEYEFVKRIPAKGKLALKCSKEGHEPDTHADW